MEQEPDAGAYASNPEFVQLGILPLPHVFQASRFFVLGIGPSVRETQTAVLVLSPKYHKV